MRESGNKTSCMGQLVYRLEGVESVFIRFLDGV